MIRAPNTFKNESVPKAYVAGLGRGANAFQTSAAYGTVSTPAVPSFGAAPAGYIPGSGRGTGGFGEKKPEPIAPGGLSGGEGGRFDPMLGYEGSLFKDGEYGSEDQYADAVYAGVDELRKKKEKKPLVTSSNVNNKKAIADDFADLKTKLKQVSADEWGSIPEARSRTKRPAKQDERVTPVTDSLLALAASNAMSSSKREDLSGLSAARDQMMRVNLDRAGDSVLGQTVVDPRGVLTALSAEMSQAAQVGDAKKARLLLKSVTSTNPNHGPGWIAAARVEELTGKISSAREIMRKACEICNDQEDVWLEAARIETIESAKGLLAKAISTYLPKSVSLWLAAADLEITNEKAIEEGVARVDQVGSWARKKNNTTSLKSNIDSLIEMQVTNRKTILLRALEKIPDSAKIWSNAYSLETNDEKAKELLLRATICCPSSVEFWISLSRLENDTTKAQMCLNQARKNFPGEIRIRVAAARLVEEIENTNLEVNQMLNSMIQQGVKRIAAHVDRNAWLRQAEECETLQYPKTCEAIIRACIGLSIDPMDRQRTWLADADAFEAKSFETCVRTTIEILLETFPDDEDIWMKGIEFEKRKGTNKVKILERAVKSNPTSQLFWLMLAKETWLSGDLASARKVLQTAFESLKDSVGEEMWFAAAKLAHEVSISEARTVFEKARENCPDSERVWIKSIVFERRMPQSESREEDLTRTALKQFPRSEKLWLMLGQVLEFSRTDLAQAKEVYSQGLDVCNKKSVKLWLALARVEEKLNTSVATSRAVLANARSKIPNSPEIWLASIRLEKRAQQNDSVIDSYLARGLQACPDDGSLLCELIETAPEAKKDSVAEDAVRRSQSKDARVILTVALVWWRKRPIEAKKVRRWLQRAIDLNKKYGDAWAAMYRFEENAEERTNIIKKCTEAAPSQGERWIEVSKARGNEDLTVEQILKRVADNFSREYI